MTGDAFSANVKPGGLTSAAQIRILLCYLIQTTAVPLTQEHIKTALLGEELVNYFELADALEDLTANALATRTGEAYSLTTKGAEIAATLQDDLPRSVRECAVRAVILAQQFARKQAQHKATIHALANGYALRCHIDDLGEEVFEFSLYLPDKNSAEAARERFIDKGGEIYSLMLAGLTGNRQLANEALDKI